MGYSIVVTYGRSSTVPSVHAAFYAGLSGPKQTSGRGEVTSFIDAVAYIRQGFDFCTDYEALATGWRGQFWRRPHEHANPDLWLRLQQLVMPGERWRDITVRKVESHCGPDEVAAGRISLSDCCGNTIAGELARVAADAFEFPRAIFEVNQRIEQTANLIQNRALAIETQLHKNDPPKDVNRYREKKARVSTTTKPLQATNHKMSLEDNQWKCDVCHQVISRHCLIKWLREGPCKPPTTSSLAASRPCASFQVGRQQAHPSHELHYLQDQQAAVCTVCGGWAKEKLRKLAKPCPKVLNKHGAKVLRNIEQGLDGYSHLHDYKSARASNAK